MDRGEICKHMESGGMPVRRGRADLWLARLLDLPPLLPSGGSCLRVVARSHLRWPAAHFAVAQQPQGHPALLLQLPNVHIHFGKSAPMPESQPLCEGGGGAVKQRVCVCEEQPCAFLVYGGRGGTDKR